MPGMIPLFTSLHHNSQAKRVYIVNFDRETDVFCRACHPYPHATPDNYVSCCDRTFLSNIGLDELLYGYFDVKSSSIVYDHDKMKKICNRKIQNMTKCVNCSVNKFCGGACSGTAYQRNRDFYVPYDKECEIIKYLYDEIGNDVVFDLFPISFFMAVVLYKFMSIKPKLIKVEDHLVFDPSSGTLRLRIVNVSRFKLKNVYINAYFRIHIPESGRHAWAKLNLKIDNIVCLEPYTPWNIATKPFIENSKPRSDVQLDINKYDRGKR